MRPFAPARKQAMVRASTAAIGSHVGALQTRVAETCSEADFTALYGRDIATVLSLIASRADCLAGTTYAQGGVVCPLPVCGNGMVEGDALRDEECDDGNLTPGDGCSAACMWE